MFRLTLLIFLYCAFTFSVFHKAAEAKEHFPDKDRLLQVSNDTLWLKLMYYQDKDFRGRHVSFVDDDRFFLAPDGKGNPLNELKANLEILKDNIEKRCLFPARFNFLKDQFKQYFKNDSLQVCEEYLMWRQELNTERVILVFAASYLNSPSSMYGHTFIRFDPKNIEQHSTLLSHVINFGAQIPDNENGLLYAFRGIAGGYPGHFASNPYFEKIKEYNRTENRDLWEYELDLSKEEIDVLLAHVWELRGINFDYYFFDENCSYRLLELLDIARPELELAKEFPRVAIPIDTVRAVRQQGLIKDVYYRPSVRTHLDHQLSALPKSHRALAIRMSEDLTVRDSSEFLQLPILEQQQIVHASYRLIRYRYNREDRTQSVSKRSFELLKMIRQYPSVTINQPKTPSRPDLGHDTTMFAVTLGTNENDVFTDLSYRVSYHDLLDNDFGYDNGLSLNMGKIVVRAYQDEVQLQHLNLLDITSLTPRTDYSKPWSWHVNLGLERQWTSAKEELVVQANGGRGVTYTVFKDDLAYAMLTGRAEYNESLDKSLSVAAGAKIGYLKKWASGKTAFTVGRYKFISDITRSEIKLEHNINLGKSLAFRFKALRQINDSIHNDEVGLSLRYYF